MANQQLNGLRTINNIQRDGSLQNLLLSIKDSKLQIEAYSKKLQDKKSEAQSKAREEEKKALLEKQKAEETAKLEEKKVEEEKKTEIVEKNCWKSWTTKGYACKRKL